MELSSLDILGLCLGAGFALLMLIGLFFLTYPSFGAHRELLRAIHSGWRIESIEIEEKCIRIKLDLEEKTEAPKKRPDSLRPESPKA